jgi:hypothetical protein
MDDSELDIQIVASNENENHYRTGSFLLSTREKAMYIFHIMFLSSQFPTCSFFLVFGSLLIYQFSVEISVVIANSNH